MYEALISHLRECAKYDKAENTFKEAADAIERLEKEVQNWKITACEEASGLEHWFENYQKDICRWIPVTERLPKKERKNYWCYTNAGEMCECRWTNSKYGFGISDKWGWSIIDVPQYQHITHWMNLPEPPEEET